MNVGQFAKETLTTKLCHSGLDIQTGPFVVRIRARIKPLIEQICILYQDFPVSKDGFADFHINIDERWNIIRGGRRQAACRLNGENVFLPLPRNQALGMFESGLNWAIFTSIYHYLILHAAAVERNGYAAILTAPSGSGKSTLCAALINRGWRLLTDELTILSASDRKILPLARPVSLKNDAISLIRQFAPQAIFGHEIPNTSKGTIAYMRAPQESVTRMNDSAIPAWLIFPEYAMGKTLEAESMGKVSAFTRIPSGLVNYPVLGSLGFHLLTQLIDETDCYSLIYSDLDEAIDWFENLRPSNRAAER